ncbi:MAG: T9SS type A sorting domain-containing protein [Flavobacteriales bacterium]
MDLYDLVSNAHIVVVGTCDRITSQQDPTRPGIVGTHVYFRNVEMMRNNTAWEVDLNNGLDIDYLGGEADGAYLGVSDMPNFRIGERYLLFLLHDGTKYISPLVGGMQGQYRILQDERTGEQYILNMGGHGLVEVLDGKFINTTQPVERVVDGTPHFLPAPVDPLTEDLTQDDPIVGGEEGSGSLLPLAAFAAIVHSVIFTEPSLHRWMHAGLPTPSLPIGTRGPSAPAPQRTPRGPLGACQYQEVYIWFEEVPTNWWSYPIDDNSKGIWDVHMNIYSDTSNPDDGTWAANNGESEICGWPSNSAIYGQYGFSWGTYIGVCFTNGSSACGEITESDIAFNPDYAWTDDWNVAYTTTAINYRSVVMHELGHSWGYQTGSNYSESYDYGYPSVMQGYSNDFWEDGKEIHSRDAEIYRNLYDSQTAVRDVDDMGVESYRATTGTGLVNSYPSDYVVQTGGTVNITPITVENNSEDAQSYVHLRFYLSTNRTLSSGDYLVEDFALGTRSAESRLIDNYVLDLDGVPAGVYYVCARVSISGYDPDDRPANDITWSTYTITVTGGVGIAETGNAPELGVFPNPATDIVQIILPEGVGEYEMMLVDAEGRVHQPTAAMSSLPTMVSLDMSGMAAGVYTVRLSDREKGQFLARLVKL